MPSLDALVNAAVPAGIRMDGAMTLPAARSEHDALAWLKSIMGKNRVLKSFIGQGYHGTHTPGVIQRNILENPGWYTAYTPYQAEIAQGRLEALLNFQTMITDLTGAGCFQRLAARRGHRRRRGDEPGTRRQAEGQGDFRLRPLPPADHRRGDDPRRAARHRGGHRRLADLRRAGEGVFAVLVQYPDTRGRIDDFAEFFAKAKAAGVATIVAADLLALTVLQAAGRVRRGHLHRLLAALRRADGLRRTARGIHGLRATR